jgi:hypothetical protein
MSLMGLGCVKTRRRGEPIEWTFRQIAISAVRSLKLTQFSIDQRKIILFVFEHSGFSHSLGHGETNSP